MNQEYLYNLYWIYVIAINFLMEISPKTYLTSRLKSVPNGQLRITLLYQKFVSCFVLVSHCRYHHKFNKQEYYRSDTNYVSPNFRQWIIMTQWHLCVVQDNDHQTGITCQIQKHTIGLLNSELQHIIKAQFQLNIGVHITKCH